MADVKTMVNASGSVGREVPVTQETSTPVVPGDYHEFGGNQANMFETYEKRLAKLEAALGNRDSVKG